MAGGGQIMHILIIEDDPELCSTYVEALELEGSTAIGVKSLQEARQQLASATFDVVISDLSLDDQPLDITLEFLHAIPAHVIVVTGRQEAHKACLEAGFDFMLKPFRITELIERVNAL